MAGADSASDYIDDPFDEGENSDNDPDWNLKSYATKQRGNMEAGEVALLEQMTKKKHDGEGAPSCSSTYNPAGESSSSSISSSNDEGEEEEECSLPVDDIKEQCMRVLIGEMRRSSGARKLSFEKKLNEIKLVDTPRQIEKFYNDKIEILKQKISKLETERADKLPQCEAYWRVMEKTMPKCGRVRIRAAQKKKEGGRESQMCPLMHCGARMINVGRHLKVVHGMDDYSKRLRCIERAKKGQWEKALPLRNSSLPLVTERVPRKCYLCDKKMKRLDCHLVTVHSLKRGTERFSNILNLVSRTAPSCNTYGCMIYI